MGARWDVQAGLRGRKTFSETYVRRSILWVHKGFHIWALGGMITWENMDTDSFERSCQEPISRHIVHTFKGRGISSQASKQDRYCWTMTVRFEKSHGRKVGVQPAQVWDTIKHQR